MHQKNVVVIGAGLAGSEAAWQLAKRGIGVDLFEMRPHRKTEAHQSAGFAELVCSNSLGSVSEHSASRILKDELTAMGSFLLEGARQCSVPAGASLAVDRIKFSDLVTEKLSESPSIKIHREEVAEIPNDRIVIIASGPLTSPSLSQNLTKMVGTNSLYFYDAISPIVATESLDLSKMFFANRWDKGETKDFLNIPLDKETYDQFVDDLLSGEVMLPHEFEEAKYFESCLPIETIASRGRQTLAFGPMKPVGLHHPETGKRAHAVIQLRAENEFKTSYNLVGFQTKLKYKEQERVFRKLPGLENAEFVRLGSMHRNTYLDSPRLLTPMLSLKANPNIFVAGQMTGTEGYLESIATGFLAGMNVARHIEGLALRQLPRETILGSLIVAITDPEKKNFQPMNVNIGILPPLEVNCRKDKKLRNSLHSERSRKTLEIWLNQQDHWKGELYAPPPEALTPAAS